MKSRRIVSFVLVFPVLAGCFSVFGVAGPTARAQEAASEQPTPKAEAKSGPHYGTHTCPIIPIAVYGGDTLYQANYYETDDCDPYTITYVFGTFQYPRTCPNCGQYASDSAATFPGLTMPVPADYEHSMPAGKPRKYSRKALTPDRIEYLYLKKQKVYVKVFGFDVNRKDMKDDVVPDPKNFTETIYFAFQCSDPASIGVNVAEIEVVRDDEQTPVPGEPTGTVYDVTYKRSGNAGEAHILTFLCGDPEPQFDLRKRAASDQ